MFQDTHLDLSSPLKTLTVTRGLQTSSKGIRDFILPTRTSKSIDPMLSRPASGMTLSKVHCPMNCQASEFAHTQGSSLHPASSSICTSAILDGVLSPSGGEILVTTVGPVEQYTGAAFNGISVSVYRQHTVPETRSDLRSRVGGLCLLPRKAAV